MKLLEKKQGIKKYSLTKEDFEKVKDEIKDKIRGVEIFDTLGYRQLAFLRDREGQWKEYHKHRYHLKVSFEKIWDIVNCCKEYKLTHFEVWDEYFLKGWY